MSLSRLEKDAVAAEEARVAALRARAARALKDEEQLKRKEAEERKAHLRYCFKGACTSGDTRELHVGTRAVLSWGSRASRRVVVLPSLERQCQQEQSRGSRHPATAFASWSYACCVTTCWRLVHAGGGPW